MKKLNSNVQLIKWFMAFLIILHHEMTSFGYFNNSLFTPVIEASLTIFILLNGFLKVNSKNYNFFKFTILIFICLIINTIMILILRKTSNINVVNILVGGRDWWYIWCFIMVQFLVPYLNLFLNTFNKWFSLFILFLAFFICVYINKRGWLQFYQMFNLGNLYYFITFYLIGGWIRKWMKVEGLKSFIIYLSTTITTYIYMEIKTPPHQGDGYWGTANTTIFIFAITLFLLLISGPSYNNKFIDYLGKLSLYVYLFHYIIQTLLIMYIFQNQKIVMNIYLQRFLYGICIFIATNIFVTVISFITEKSADLIYKQWLKVLPYIKLK